MRRRANANGPGTGKSVIAINLLGALIGRERNARYVSKNRAPRAVYESKLVTQLIKKVMLDGKKSIADRTVYATLEKVEEKSGIQPVE